MEHDLADLLPAYYYIPLRCGNQNGSGLCGRICTHILYMALATTICFGGFFYYQSHYLQQNASTPLWANQASLQSEDTATKIENIESIPSTINLENMYEKFGKNVGGKCNEDDIRQLMKDLEVLGQEVSSLQEWKKIMNEGLTTTNKEQNEQIEENVDQALNIYSADEIGLMDYAASYSGGAIESVSKDTRPFPTYRPWTLFKIIHFDVLSSPDEILKTSTLPGSCFAFQGSKAEIKIRLAGAVEIGSITMSHASKLLLGEEGMKSAPQDFEVYGYLDTNENNAIFLGKFSYNIKGIQHQTFIIEENLAKSKLFQYVQLNILSNYGKEEFTCLYRFRVHGKAMDEFSEQKGCPGCRRH